MKQKKKISLPIDPYLPSIIEAAQEYSTLLIKSSPGSGKTTRLPWPLTQSLGGRVIVLEPRKLAAKLAASRIAEEEEKFLGNEIGYQFRFENKTSKNSRLIFYTEGTFLRVLAGDPELSGVSAIILDEFHERHLETDLALAALRNLQEKRDLKLIIMSATLNVEHLEYFKRPKVFDIEAPHFPVELNYLPNVPSVLDQKLELKVRDTLKAIPPTGDVLVFLPGMREMQRTLEVLGHEFGEVYLLHSEISKEEQEKALGKNPKRKIILSTTIAESSVTIPGIKYVIDSGISRESHYSPWTGLKTLVDRPVTQSSAIQRAGRAGRTAPGECFRLYPKMDFESREKFGVPEILKADLLDAYVLSRGLLDEPRWLAPPPKDRWEKAQKEYHQLGLEMNRERLSRFPLDARLSRVLLAADDLSAEAKGKLLNFILEKIEGSSFYSLKHRFDNFLRSPGEKSDWEKALLAGFINQVSLYRQKQHDFIHYSGKTLKAHSSLRDLSEGYYLILDVTPRQEAILVVSIEEEWLYEVEPFPFSEEVIIDVQDKVRFKTLTKLGSLVIDEVTVTKSWEGLSSDLKAKTLRELQAPFLKRVEKWKLENSWGRVLFWTKLKGKEIADFDSLLSLTEYFEKMGDIDFKNLDFYLDEKLQEYLEGEDLSRSLPAKLDLGGRRELEIHYPEDAPAFVEAPIQDFYGQKTTPSILGGKHPLVVKLLGPHKRPIQITQDLVGFWERTYPEFKKEYQRDYPRHYWPDDPKTAKPILLKRMLPQG